MRRPAPPREIGITEFSGGLNLRDAPTELANNESPKLWNVTLDERGGIQKRFGYIEKNATIYTTASAPQNLFEWKTNGVVVTQCGAELFKDDGVASVKTFTTAARVGFAEFGTKVYAIHPIDGLFSSSDGTTWAAVVGSPKGTAIEPWQTRLLAIGDPSNPTTLYACKINDATVWTTGVGEGWTNQIREHDSEPLVAIKAASGIDIAGRPGVLVFKNRSSYRINNSDTGAYQTIDTDVGAASALSVTSLGGETFVLHQSGVYGTDGVGRLKLLSGKLDKLFTKDEVAFDKAALFCAGAIGDRVHFSLPRAGSSANDLHLEYHPSQGWFVTGSDAVSCYLTFTDETEKLYGGSPTVAGQVWQMQTGGADNGADIDCYYQTKWIAPFGGIEARFRRLRVFGRGTFSVFVKFDFATGDGDENEVVLPGGAVWGAATWSEEVWGPARYESKQDFWSLGIGTHIALLLRETSSKEMFGPAVLDVGPPVPLGAFGLYGVSLLTIPISA